MPLNQPEASAAKEFVDPSVTYIDILVEGKHFPCMWIGAIIAPSYQCVHLWQAVLGSAFLTPT